MKNRSLGFRLAAWYALVLSMGLTIFSIAAWFGMQASLYHAVNDELRDRVRGVERFMQQQIASLSIPEIRDEFREHSVLGPGGDLFQVADEQGEWLYRSVSLEGNNVSIARAGDLGSPRIETLQVQGRALRFYSERISVNGKSYVVQVAAPMSEGVEALERFRLLLLIAAPLLLSAASAGGYWISTRALAPVDEISQAAQRISIENLTERLEVPQTGDQLERLSRTLNHMLSRLEASVRRMAQFTADASHELRAPVSLIRTTAEVALIKDRSAEEYRRALTNVLEESERTSRVIDSLMLLARADSQAEILDTVPVDAFVIVRSAAEQGERLAQTRGLQFSLDLPLQETICVKADGEALRRALLILLDNATKYTPAGGSVALRLEARNGIAAVSVADTGIGIAREDIPHIFDRFWRADKARSRAQGGVGLGLSIAKWIADVHGCSIVVRSELGKGSTFELRIPMTGCSNS